MDLKFWKFQIFRWCLGFHFQLRKIHVSATNHVWISKFPSSFWGFKNLRKSGRNNEVVVCLGSYVGLFGGIVGPVRGFMDWQETTPKEFPFFLENERKEIYFEDNFLRFFRGYPFLEDILTVRMIQKISIFFLNNDASLTDFFCSIFQIFLRQILFVGENRCFKLQHLHDGGN